MKELADGLRLPAQGINAKPIEQIQWGCQAIVPFSANHELPFPVPARAAPRGLVKSVSGGATCDSDPVIGCLSDFVLKLTASCGCVASAHNKDALGGPSLTRMAEGQGPGRLWNWYPEGWEEPC
jgi:hypothetical protein